MLIYLIVSIEKRDLDFKRNIIFIFFLRRNGKYKFKIKYKYKKICNFKLLSNNKNTKFKNLVKVYFLGKYFISTIIKF